VELIIRDLISVEGVERGKSSVAGTLGMAQVATTVKVLAPTWGNVNF